MTIREAIRELDLWGAGAVFSLTEYEDSNKNTIHLIKDWKDLVNQVCNCTYKQFSDCKNCREFICFSCNNVFLVPRILSEHEAVGQGLKIFLMDQQMLLQ